jgi:hypothetical protein
VLGASVLCGAFSAIYTGMGYFGDDVFTMTLRLGYVVVVALAIAPGVSSGKLNPLRLSPSQWIVTGAVVAIGFFALRRLVPVIMRSISLK